MANGQRRGGPGRGEETRFAPEEDEDATRDIPAHLSEDYRPEETRLAPPEPPGSETRIGPLDEQEDIVTEARKGQAAAGRPQSTRSPDGRGARGQEVIQTEARPSGRAQGAGGSRGQDASAAEARGRGQEVIQTEARPSGRGQEVIQTEARASSRGQEVIQTEARGAGRAQGAAVAGRAQGTGAADGRGGGRAQGAGGSAGRGGPGRGAEAPDEDEATSSIRLPAGEDDLLPFPLEPDEAEDAPPPFATEVRGSGGALATEVRGGAPPVLRPEKGKDARGGAPVAKPSGWLSRGNDKPPAPPQSLTAGVVRLSPLEPAAGKVAAAAADEGPALRTMFANHSALLAEQLREALSKKMYGRGPHRVLRIDEPEGPSTAGGKLARQAISLVPRKGSGPTLMCGWVDVSKRESQLRSHEAVAKRYESQYGEPLELTPEEYERFLHDVEEVLAKAVIKVRLIVPEEQVGAKLVAPAAQAQARGGMPMVLVLLLMGAAFALGLFVGRTPPG